LSPEHEEVAELLLRKARGDLGAAQALNAAEGHPDYVVGFHLQQTVEKALKAILAINAVEILYTHNLNLLVDAARGAGADVPDVVAGAGPWLTPWGVTFRYDEDDDDLDRDAALEAATAAVALAEAVLAERRT
jgi:HEPN domain-containing protein